MRPQEPRLALVDVQLPREALDARPGESLPAGLTLRIFTSANADVLEVLDLVVRVQHPDNCVCWCGSCSYAIHHALQWLMLQEQVPLDAPADSAEHRECTVWEWHGPAIDAGDEAAEWFSAHLGKPVRLVRYGGKSPLFRALQLPNLLKPSPMPWAVHMIDVQDPFPLHQGRHCMLMLVAVEHRPPRRGQPWCRPEAAVDRRRVCTRPRDGFC